VNHYTTTAPTAIREALRLGILCRPTSSAGPKWIGEAFEVSETCFWLYAHDGTSHIFHPSPDLFLFPWELVTKDMLRAEWREFTEVGF
jgi:hypothetical protein